MNIDSVSTHSTSSLDSINQANKTTTLSEVFPSIGTHLEVLSLLSNQVLSSEHSKFTSVVSHLNQKEINFSACKLLFVEAYIHDFNQMEQDFFLSRFFDYFDPTKEIVLLDQMSLEEKGYFWTQIITFLCASYMDFPTGPISLQETFCKTVKDPSSFNETEETLEKRFDNGMELFRDFSPHSTHPTEIKILFASYLARLISRLEELQSQDEKSDLPEENIESFFEELYFYLLSMPCSNLGEEDSVPLMSLMKEDIKLMDGEALRQSFIQHLVQFFEKQNTDVNQIQSLIQVFEEVHFLDFQI